MTFRSAEGKVDNFPKCVSSFGILCFYLSHGVGKEAELTLDLIPPISFILITSWGRALGKLQLARQFAQVHNDRHGAKMQFHVSCP